MRDTSSCDERVGTSATRSDLRKDGGAAQSSGSAAVAKGPGARAGERSFGRHPSNSFTTCGLRGQGQGMVNVLLAANPQRLVHDLMRLRARRQDWWTFLCSQPSNRVRAANAEVVNELLWGGGQKNGHQPWPLAP